MKSLLMILLPLFFSTSLYAQTSIVTLNADKTIYASGDTAILRANFLAKPDNTDFQFDALATLDGQAVTVDRVTDFQMFSTVKNLTTGNHTWQVTVVIQDARYAQDLKDSITYYTNLIASLDSQIAAATDPTVIANLQKRKDDAVNIKTAAESELQNIRSPVMNPLTLQFTVQ
ncbi:MAG: hypothetical protein ACXWPX_11005 [Pseudobdellovibrio sp.]